MPVADFGVKVTGVALLLLPVPLLAVTVQL